MGYNVNYDLYNLQGNVTKRRSWACFSEFYNYAKGRDKKVDVYVLKKYKKEEGWSYNSNPFTSEEVAEYARLLKTMGFKFKFQEMDTEYMFSIDFTKTSTQEYKTLLNCIRYLHECQGPSIVEHFLRFSKEKVVGVTNFAKLQIACHCKVMNNYGHTFLLNMSPQMLLSKAEFKRLILDNNSNNGVSTSIPAGKKPYRGSQDFKDLLQLFENKESFKVIFKKYKELWLKYM